MKILKDSDKKAHLFRKGESGNAKGKPKGAINKSTVRYTELKTLASERYSKAFDMLWSQMEKGDGWAFQIYFKDLVPKRIHQQTLVVHKEDGVDRVDLLNRALTQIEELTHEEALDELRTLKNIQQKEIIQTENKGTIDEMVRLVKESWNK